MSEDFTGTADVPPSLLRSFGGLASEPAEALAKAGPSASGLSGSASADKMSAVPVKSRSLVLAAALHRQLIAESRAAFPRECCGLIEGVRRGDTVEAIALHPTRNLATASDRFEIDPAEHIRLLRALRGTGRDIVGCYHSHPNVKAAPSARDRDGAHEKDFIWLIYAEPEPRAFVWTGADFADIQLTAAEASTRSAATGKSRG
ncbi:MAG TPA: M67 family metallopeptidase [Rhizomicrobium sp.]|nr:M67 family metallopeptidase [Rhizomicrobium sp.]